MLRQAQQPQAQCPRFTQYYYSYFCKKRSINGHLVRINKKLIASLVFSISSNKIFLYSGYYCKADYFLIAFNLNNIINIKTIVYLNKIQIILYAISKYNKSVILCTLFSFSLIYYYKHCHKRGGFW